MIESVHIRNLALVEDLRIGFAAGLNALTGETGAGKSLVLGALQLLSGERADTQVIRHGADSCEVTAVLGLGTGQSSVADAVNAILADAGVPPCDDGTLLLRRVVTSSGSRCYINSSPVTVSLLRRLGDLLIDLHGPHEHQSLLQPRLQLGVVDAFADLEDGAAACAEAHAEAEALAQTHAGLRQETGQPEEITFLQHQLREIEDAELSQGEEDELVRRHTVLANARRLLELAAQGRAGLSESDDSVADRFGRIVRLMQEMADLDPDRVQPLLDRADGVVEAVRDLSFELAGYADTMDLDGDALLRVEERLDIIQRLKRKHGGTMEAVLLARDEMRARLAAVEERSERLAEAAAALTAARRAHLALCRDLHRARTAAADRIGEAISTKLQRLGFAQSRFEVELEEAAPGPTGTTRVEFSFAPNPGEPPRPLRRIASSGEMARVMLAIKTVLSAADRVPILVFDEVDANIGGRTAVTVADELAAISTHHQVLSVTHLPQIAAAGQAHFRVHKTVREDGRTVTHVDHLDPADREHEILRMLGAGEDSGSARQHARELLQRGARGQTLVPADREACP